MNHNRLNLSLNEMENAGLILFVFSKYRLNFKKIDAQKPQWQVVE